MKRAACGPGTTICIGHHRAVQLVTRLVFFFVLLAIVNVAVRGRDVRRVLGLVLIRQWRAFALEAWTAKPVDTRSTFGGTLLEHT
jgi:hypothetical protein